MEELINKKKLIADLKGIKDVLTAAGDPFLANIINRAIGCVENQPVVLMGVDLAMEVKTGGNRVRSMTDNELLNFIMDMNFPGYTCPPPPALLDRRTCPCNSSGCRKCWEFWLTTQIGG